MNAHLREAEKVLTARSELLRSTEAALQEMTDRAESRVSQLRLIQTETAQLDENARAQIDGLVVAYEARVAALHKQNAEMHRALEALREDHARAEQSTARAAELEHQLAHVSGELAATRVLDETLSVELNQARAQLQAIQEREVSDADQLEDALRAVSDSANKLESARTDNAVLQGAIEALRAECANLRRGVNGGKGLSVVPVTASDAEIASLREAIIEFGDRVVAQEFEAPAKRA
jgi:chromosome segregation ATPase